MAEFTDRVQPKDFTKMPTEYHYIAEVDPLLARMGLVIPDKLQGRKYL